MSNLGRIALFYADTNWVNGVDFLVIDRGDGKGPQVEKWPNDAETTASLLAKEVEWQLATETADLLAIEIEKRRDLTILAEIVADMKVEQSIRDLASVKLMEK